MEKRYFSRSLYDLWIIGQTSFSDLLLARVKATLNFKIIERNVFTPEHTLTFNYQSAAFRFHLAFSI
jgi:hypothetical protein